MKKIICAAMAAAMLMTILTGCGGSKAVVPNDDGEGYVLADLKPRETLPKVKPRSKTEPAAETDNDGNTQTTAAGQTIPDTTDADGNIIDITDETPGNDDSSGNAPEAGEATTEKSADKQETATEAAVEEYFLEGIVFEVKNGSILLNETDFQQVDVQFDPKVKLDDIKIGDRVLITYDGELPEKAPYTAKGATAVKVTEKAAKSYTMQTFTKNDLKFSLLVPDDWESREIEYPTEGDFTDWGIRLTAKGAKGGLDISWHSAFAIKDPYDIKPTTINGNNVSIYSKNGKWRFYVYDNDFIAGVSFTISDDYSEYDETMRFMLETLTF